jgi:mannose-6-phosphate isomerase-like protein (cupin superfamily)
MSDEQQELERGETPWEPEPVPAEEFHAGEWANVNRAPHDEVAGVLYKRAASIKRVRYEPLNPAPEEPEIWQGDGEAVVRWLFSEGAGTEEGLLSGKAFACIQEVRMQPGAASGMVVSEELDHILYVVSGEGALRHRPGDGSPVVVRPLRPGDAALIREGVQWSVASESQVEELRIVALGLQRAPPR